MDSERGVVTPPVFPLHPMWMALVNGCAGTALSLMLRRFGPRWGLRVSLRLPGPSFGYRVGLLSGVLLVFSTAADLLCPLSTAESLTQTLIWFGLYGLARFDDEGGRHWES